MFYLTTHLTHFIYGYMESDIWQRTTQIVREETRCRHMGYSFRLAARVLLYASSHRQDNTYHGLCYTSRGTLTGTCVHMGACVCVCVCTCDILLVLYPRYILGGGSSGGQCRSSSSRGGNSSSSSSSGNYSSSNSGSSINSSSSTGMCASMYVCMQLLLLLLLLCLLLLLLSIIIVATIGNVEMTFKRENNK